MHVSRSVAPSTNARLPLLAAQAPAGPTGQALIALVCERFRAVAAGTECLAAGIGAMLDEVVRLNEIDPAIARSLGAAALDTARGLGSADAFAGAWAQTEAIIRGLVERAAEAGEFEGHDVEMAVDTVRALLVGILLIADWTGGANVQAVEGVKQLLGGTLR